MIYTICDKKTDIHIMAAPERRQAIIWTNARLLLIGPRGTNFNAIFIKMQQFSFKKMRLKILSEKWRPFCFGPQDWASEKQTDGVTHGTGHDNIPGRKKASLQIIWLNTVFFSIVWGELTIRNIVQESTNDNDRVYLKSQVTMDSPRKYKLLRHKKRNDRLL